MNWWVFHLETQISCTTTSEKKKGTVASFLKLYKSNLIKKSVKQVERAANFMQIDQTEWVWPVCEAVA